MQISTSEVEQRTEVPAIATYLKLDVNRSALVNDGEANLVVLDLRDAQLLCAERGESDLSDDPSCLEENDTDNDSNRFPVRSLMTSTTRTETFRGWGNLQTTLLLRNASWRPEPRRSP